MLPSKSLSRRGFIKAAAGALAAAPLLGQSSSANSSQPNLIIILADDLGFGDLHCYGSNIPTPNIDAMANEGIKLQHFYATSPVCSPSRAALLTGHYPPRTGVPDVMQVSSTNGILDTETTLPQMLKGVGYQTMCIGKWHVGSLPQYMPNKRGFDQFYGLPYSNDMDPLPLLQNTTVIEQPANQSTLTQRYTQQALNFISNAKGPFFLYLAHTFPHVPLAVSPGFKGKTGMGLYADSIAEIDWSVGQVMQSLKDKGVDNNTMVVFTSDNGPWFQGSPGSLRGRKGETFEGGVREPFIARFPGAIPAGQVNASTMASMMDLFPTFGRLAGAKMPAAPLDGVDIWPLLSGGQDSINRDVYLYFDSIYIQAARLGRYKLHIARYNTPPWAPLPAEGRMNLPLRRPELYDMLLDPEESTNIAADHPDVVADIQKRISSLMPGMPSQVQVGWSITENTLVGDCVDGGWPSKYNPQ